MLILVLYLVLELLTFIGYNICIYNYYGELYAKRYKGIFFSQS